MADTKIPQVMLLSMIKMSKCLSMIEFGNIPLTGKKRIKNILSQIILVVTPKNGESTIDHATNWKI